MPRFCCAVADCKADVRKKIKKHPWMKEVKGFTRFPTKRFEPQRRELWERLCKREAGWHAGLYSAVCSRHFVEWNNGPSDEHPDPELFPYNNWGKNCSTVTLRPRKSLQLGSVPQTTTKQEKSTDVTECELNAPYVPPPSFTEWKGQKRARKHSPHQEDGTKKQQDKIKVPKMTVPVILTEEEVMGAAYVPRQYRSQKSQKSLLTGAQSAPVMSRMSVLDGSQATPKDVTPGSAASSHPAESPLSIIYLGQFSGLRSILTNTPPVTSKEVHVSALSDAEVSVGGTPIGSQPSGIGRHVLASSCGSNLTSSTSVNLVSALLKPRSIPTSSTMALANGRPCLISQPALLPVRNSLGTPLIRPGKTLTPTAPGSLIIRPTSHPKDTGQITNTLPSTPPVSASANDILAQMGAKTVTVSRNTGQQKILVLNPGNAPKVSPQATSDQHTYQKWRVVNGHLVAVERKFSSQSCETTLAQETETETGDDGLPSNRVDGGVIVIEPDSSNVSYESLNRDIRKEGDKVCFPHFEELPKNPQDCRELDIIDNCAIPTVAPITIAPCGDKSETTELKSEEGSVKDTSHLSLTSLLGTVHYSKATNNTLSSVIGVVPPIENLTVSKKESINMNPQELTIALDHFINENKLAYELSDPEIIKKLSEEFWSLPDEQKEVYKKLADDVRLNGPEARTSPPEEEATDIVTEGHGMGWGMFLTEMSLTKYVHIENVQMRWKSICSAWSRLSEAEQNEWHERSVHLSCPGQETPVTETTPTSSVTTPICPRGKKKPQSKSVRKNPSLFYHLFVKEKYHETRKKIAKEKGVDISKVLLAAIMERMSKVWKSMGKEKKDVYRQLLIKKQEQNCATANTPKKIKEKLRRKREKFQKMKFKANGIRSFKKCRCYWKFVTEQFNNVRADIAAKRGMNIRHVHISDVSRRLAQIWNDMDPQTKYLDKTAKKRKEKEKTLMADRSLGLNESPAKPLILLTALPQELVLPAGNPDLELDPMSDLASDLKPEPVSQSVSDPVPESGIDYSPNNAKVNHAWCRPFAMADGGYDEASCMGGMVLCEAVGDTNVKHTGVDEGERGDVEVMHTTDDKDKMMCTGGDVKEEMCIYDDMDKEMCPGEGEVGEEMCFWE